MKKKAVKNNPRFIPVQYGLHLGGIIREKIRAKGLYQKDLAPLLNITTQGVQNKLNSPVFGSIYDLITVCIFLNVDLLDLCRKQLAQNGNPVFVGQEEMTSNLITEYKRKISNLQEENKLLESLAKLRDNKKS